MVNSNFGIDLYLKKIKLGLINFELKFPIKKLHPQIKAPSIILIQKYFFHDNSSWNINYLE